MTDYKIVKPDKRMLSYWHKYNLYRGRTLSDCYKKPSVQKKNAWDACCKMAATHNATPTVLSYNDMYFSVGFIADDCFVVVTSSKTFSTKVRELHTT